MFEHVICTIVAHNFMHLTNLCMDILYKVLWIDSHGSLNIRGWVWRQQPFYPFDNGWWLHFGIVTFQLGSVLSGTFHYTFCCEDFNCVKAYSLMNNMTKTNFYPFELNSWFIVSFFSRSHLVGSKRQASNTILQVLHHVVLVGRSLLTAITIF